MCFGFFVALFGFWVFVFVAASIRVETASSSFVGGIAAGGVISVVPIGFSPFRFENARWAFSWSPNCLPAKATHFDLDSQTRLDCFDHLELNCTKHIYMPRRDICAPVRIREPVCIRQNDVQAQRRRG